MAGQVNDGNAEKPPSVERKRWAACHALTFVRRAKQGASYQTIDALDIQKHQSEIIDKDELKENSFVNNRRENANMIFNIPVHRQKTRFLSTDKHIQRHCSKHRLNLDYR